jgi:hypothetical protein
MDSKFQQIMPISKSVQLAKENTTRLGGVFFGYEEDSQRPPAFWEDLN